VLFLAAFNALPVRDGWRAVTAERVTVHVGHCPAVLTRSTPPCTGTWTLPGGRAGAGAIDGYASTQAGADLDGWATTSRATTNLVRWLLWPITGAVVTLGGLGVFAVFWLRYRRRAAGPQRLPS
jgi:hypothetical protein